MSVNPILAEHYGFRRSLVKQFYTVATIPSRERPQDKVLINYLNGTLVIRTDGRFLGKFNKNDNLTYVLPFNYDPQAQAPIWKKFVAEVLPDSESQAVLAEAIAYAFSPLKLEKVIMLYGSGANGKSVVLDVVQALLGNENVSNYSLKNLDHPYFRAKIANKLLNISSEATTSISPDEFKKLASGEPIDARNVYEQPFIVRNYARLMFSSNELPSEVEHTNAYFRRFLLIPFTVTIEKDRQDPNLAKRIIATELAGILNWVLEGLDRLNRNKSFSPCLAADKELERYRLETNSVALFCEDQGYIPSTDEKQRIKLSDLHGEYRQFCTTNGFRAVSTRKFRQRLEHLGFGSKKLNLGVVVFAERERSTEEGGNQPF
jgi:putative DNA primase/helicase